MRPSGIETTAVIGHPHREEAVVASYVDRHMPAKGMANDIANALTENQVNVSAGLKINLTVPPHVRRFEPQLDFAGAEHLSGVPPHAPGQVRHPVPVDRPDN